MCLLVDPTQHSWQFSETNQFSKWIESLHDWLFLQWSLGPRSRQVWSWRWTRPASYCWQSHPGICSNLENSVWEHFWKENFNGAHRWKYSHAGGICLGENKNNNKNDNYDNIYYTDFDIFLNAIPVSVVESPPLAAMTPACLNHLSDWLSLMLLPSAALSPNFAKETNLLFSTAVSAMISVIELFCLHQQFIKHHAGNLSTLANGVWRVSLTTAWHDRQTNSPVTRSDIFSCQH